MADILDRLYASKARAAADDERREDFASVEKRATQRLGERRPFAAALRAARGPAIVAEIKRASPSVGLIARNFEPADIAARYERAGADAISVLTEADHFLGELAYLDVARGASRLPILRKDFLSTEYQIVQSAAHGADAVLLIVAGLDDARLRALSDVARAFALDTLVEIHDEAELERAIAISPSVVGINNRDLRTFETDLGVTEHLLPLLPAGTLAISESGVQRSEEIVRLHALGARGFLIGETLMRSDNPALLIDAVKSEASAR